MHNLSRGSKYILWVTLLSYCRGRLAHCQFANLCMHASTRRRRVDYAWKQLTSVGTEKKQWEINYLFRSDPFPGRRDVVWFRGLDWLFYKFMRLRSEDSISLWFPILSHVYVNSFTLWLWTDWVVSDLTLSLVWSMHKQKQDITDIYIFLLFRVVNKLKFLVFNLWVLTNTYFALWVSDYFEKYISTSS